MNFIEEVKKNVLKYCKNTDKIAVAVSGGSDSLALVVALKQAGFDVLAILVNHNLKKEAKQEVIDTAKTLEKCGIKYTIKEWDGKYEKNLEAEARENRYKLLLNTCREHKISTLCIGHHIDDQIETFLLNVARGSGLDGLCAMPMFMVKNGIQIIRPMLTLKKQDCVEFLRSNGLSWCEDASNKDTKYKRNKLRFLLEQIEDRDLLTKRVANGIFLLQEVKEAVDDLIDEKMQDENLILISKNEAKIEINKTAFVKLKPYLQKSILTKCILKVAEKQYKPRLYQVENLIDAINTSKNFKRTLINCIIEMKNDVITIEKNNYFNPFTIFIKSSPLSSYDLY